MKLLLVSFLLLIGGTHAANTKQHPADVEQRAILRELYDATNGHAWNENTGWAHNTEDVCTWTGISCLFGSQSSPSDNAASGAGEVVSGRNPIIGINLSDNFLSGRTPPSLWKLATMNGGSLKELDLSFNPALDVDFGSLASLANANANNVVSSVLETINVRKTATTSVTGVSALKESLTKLILTENKFESQFPPDLFALRKLTALSVAECSLRGNLPDGSDSSDVGGISQLSQLRILDVYDNDLTGTLPSGLGQLVHLRSLILSKNQFHGKLPQFVNDDLVMLEQFWVNYNDFTGTIPAFDKQTSIRKLYLNGNSFTGDIPDTFLAAAITGPEEGINSSSGNSIMINLGKNEFAGTIPASLDRLAILPITWRFGGNSWTDIAPELCDNANWNDGGIVQFGCKGLICGPGSYSSAGFHTLEAPCEVCATADYFGTFECFDQDDRAVLLDLYAKLNGPNWFRNEGWSTAPRTVADDDWSEEWNDYCSWFGVECWDLGDAKDGRVRKVELGNNNVKGQMPESIFSIEHMTTLDVSNNQELVVSFRNVGRSDHLYSVNVGGTKTKDFDGIQHANDFFKRLYADNTPIAGTIPSEITRVHNLQVLSLQDCDLNGELPVDLFAMSSLEELYLSSNNFHGVLPDRWASLVNLEVLALAKNSFRGNLPESFGYAPSLRALTLKDQLSKGGGFTGSLPSFSKSRSLSQVILSDNKLDGTLPDDLLLLVDGAAPAPLLFHIDLTNNKITGTVHGSYERFEKLDLYLEGNFISEIDGKLCNNNVNPSWMSGGVGSYGCDAILCPAGTSNYGGRRKYTDDGCLPCDKKKNKNSGGSYLGQSTCNVNVADIAIAATPAAVDTTASTTATATATTTAAASSSMERSILELLFGQTGGPDGAWKSSQDWNTEANFCTWYGIDCDENGSVASIQLGSNGLKGSMPSAIWTLPNLVHLKIYGNDMDVDLTGIEGARNLQTLGLDDTGLKSLEGIGKARSLTKLNVGYNNLDGNLPEELSRLVNLQTLDVSHNKFSGELPFWIKNFVSLTSFTASHNKLSGAVADFATLAQLSYLDLSYNQFDGTLPPTLLVGSPPDDKVVVDLSHNKIEGVVPVDLSRLTRLSIQLQENQISGIDPDLCKTDGLNDFDAMSFGCNGILCPVGTWNNLGRQSNEDVPCEPCKKSKYMGTTTCGKETTTIKNNSSSSSSKPLSAALAALVFGSISLSWMMML